MKYGAKNAMWAPFSGEDAAGALPGYGDVIPLDGVNETSDSLSFAEGSAYGDNTKKIGLKEFTSGTIAAKFVWLPISTLSVILGTATDNDDGQAYSDEDNPPYGGYGFISNRMDSNKNKFHEVVFYPKVQGSADSSSYATKADSITLEYDSLPFDILLPDCGLYKIEKRFATEAEAAGYLTALFKGTAAVPGLTSPTTDAATTTNASTST